MPNITRPPSEYLSEGRLFVSTEGSGLAPDHRAKRAVTWLVWASDYPHWTPISQQRDKVERRDDLAAAVKRQLFESNPQRLSLGVALRAVITPKPRRPHELRPHPCRRSVAVRPAITS